MPFVENSGGGSGSGIPQGGPLTQSLDAGAFKVTNLGAGTLATDAAEFGQIPDGSNGQAGVIGPTSSGWSGSALAFTANRVICSRFVPRKAITVANMRFRTVGAGTGNVDVGILDATGARLASSGSTAGKKAAATNQTVALTASVALVAGTVYYLALETDVSDGTSAVATFGGGQELFFGATIGLVEAYIKDTTFPIPVSVAIGFTNTQGPIMAVTT